MVPFKLFFEAFDTVSDFLLNPEHRDKPFWKVREEFEDSGGTVIGSGSFGTVFSHPSWPYIIKLFIRDDPYVKFVRFAYNNPHPAYPKFFGKPQKIVPFYTRDPREKDLYIVRLEKLKQLSNYDEYDNLSYAVGSYWNFKGAEGEVNDPNFRNKNSLDRFQMASDIVAGFPKNVLRYCDGLYKMNMAMRQEKWGFQLDNHMGNVMVRPSDGQYVIIDPLWAGGSVPPHPRPDYAVSTRDNILGSFLGSEALVGGTYKKLK